MLFSFALLPKGVLRFPDYAIARQATILIWEILITPPLP